jgi:hypothetical protein
MDIADDVLQHKMPPFGVPRGPAIGFYAFAKVRARTGPSRF